MDFFVMQVNSIWFVIYRALHLHQKYIMPRISATFKPTIKKIAECYSIFNGISFSESVEILTSVSGLEWWNKLSKKQQKELTEKWMEAK
jgi:hypothetical protein